MTVQMNVGTSKISRQDYQTEFFSLSYKYKVCLFSKDNKIKNNIISSKNPVYFILSEKFTLFYRN